MARVVIAQLSDVHIPGAPAEQLAGSNPSDRLKSVLAVASRRSSAVLLTGDLAATRGTDDEYRALRALVADVPVPVWPVAGNHDEANRLAALFGISGRNGRCDYFVDHSGVRVVVLDSSRDKLVGGRLDAEQVDWLDTVLGGASASLVAIHHPCLAHDVVSSPSMRLDDPSLEALGSVISCHEVHAVIGGHAHVPLVGSFAGTTAIVAPSTAYEFGDRVDGRPTYREGPLQYFEHSWNDDGSGFLSRLVTVSDEVWRPLA